MMKQSEKPQSEKPQSEKEIVYAIRRAIGTMPDVVLWRNSAGRASRGDDGGERHIRFGLTRGAADLIGILTLPAGPRCLGGGTSCSCGGVLPAPIGRFFALEAKSAKGTTSELQVKFLELVRKRGGFACVVRSADAAVAAMERARKGAIE